jgi:hypothetical protein
LAYRCRVFFRISEPGRVSGSGVNVDVSHCKFTGNAMGPISGMGPHRAIEIIEATIPLAAMSPRRRFLRAESPLQILPV